MLQAQAEVLESFRGSRVLVSPKHARMTLVDPCKTDPKKIARPLKDFALEKGCSKVVAWVPASQSAGYMAEGFAREARIGAFYKGGEDCLIMSFFLDELRQVPLNETARGSVIDRALGQVVVPEQGLASSAGKTKKTLDLGDGYSFSQEELSSEIKDFFAEYRSSEEGLQSVAKEAALSEKELLHYLCVRQEGQLKALASLEINKVFSTAKLADFLTHQAYRMKGLASFIIAQALELCREQEICTAYSLVPLSCEAMNLAFGQGKFRFGGTLTNECTQKNSEEWEDVNLWYRRIRRP